MHRFLDENGICKIIVSAVCNGTADGTSLSFDSCYFFCFLAKRYGKITHTAEKIENRVIWFRLAELQNQIDKCFVLFGIDLEKTSDFPLEFEWFPAVVIQVVGDMECIVDQGFLVSVRGKRACKLKLVSGKKDTFQSVKLSTDCSGIVDISRTGFSRELEDGHNLSVVRIELKFEF